VLVGTRTVPGPRPSPGRHEVATMRARRGGSVPSFDPGPFARTVRFVAGEVAAICAGTASDVTAVHDVGGGGLAVALAEMVR